MTHPAGQRDVGIPAPPGWRTLAVWAGVLLALAAAAHLLDAAAYPGWVNKTAESKDWARLLRVAGYLPTWLLVGGGLALGMGGLRGLTRGGFIVAAAALGGLLAEIVKLLVRRGRPDDTGGAYTFVPFDTNTWDTGALGLPSSHAAVAFAGAFAVLLLWRRPGLLLVAVAAGCGLTRVLSGRHFVSDVAAAAPVGLVAAALGAWIVGRGAALVSRGGAPA